MIKKPKQLLIINSLRGVAALSVCFFHFIVTTRGYISNETIVSIFQYGKKGVQLFFIISGIVIPLSMVNSRYSITNVGKFLLKRFVRIEPPYLVAVALGIVYLYVRNFIPSATDIDLTPSFRDTILHLGYLVPFVEGAKWINPVFWTLSIEFQYYLFLAILFPLVLSKKSIFMWIFSFIIITIPFLSPNKYFFINWASYFGLGIFYALYISKTYSLKQFVVSTLLCCVTIYFQQGIIDLLLGISTLAIIHIAPNYKNDIGLFLGKISYSLYLLHSIIGAAFINFMSHIFTSSVGQFIVILSGVVISIFSAYLFWRYVEKPSQIRAQKIDSK